MSELEISIKVVIDYTNYKGQRSERTIRPISIYHDKTEHHPTPQWLLEAWDVDKAAYRTFAMKDIHSWQPSTEDR